MPDKRIVWEMPDGTIWVTIPTPKGRRQGEGETEWFDRVAAKAKPEGAVRLPDLFANDLPDRSRRHAWRKHPTSGRIWTDPSIPDPSKPVSIEDLEARIAELERRP